MTNPSVYTLVNPRNGNLAFKVFAFEDDRYFDHVQRNNYYSLIWVTRGSGQLKADFSQYPFEQDTLFAFSPYQPYMLSAENHLYGKALYFHPDFFCIHKHQPEVACNGVLFNNIYQPPFVRVDETAAATFNLLLSQMQTEMQQAAMAQYEVLVSYLKIMLITASRLRAQQQPEMQTQPLPKAPFILQHLKEAIETHFKSKHSASEYADLLNISANALARITRMHFNKTLTDLIAERIIIEAKRELYLTSKPVKEIAYELGYADEFYFSRFFKTNADISPQVYRETVGFGRGVAS